MITPLQSKCALLAFVLLLASAPYFIRLGASTLWDSNEAFYAETPRVMMETGDYVNPSFNGNPRFNKPPLSYWVVAVSYRLFGVSEASERFAIALGALVLILATFVIARELHSTEAGLYAAIALAASPRFLMFSRRIIIDVYVAMFMGLTLMFFILAAKRPRHRRLFLALMYASVGLGVMTKGPVAAALPAIALLLYLAAFKQLSRIREMMLPVGIVIVAAIVLPWYLAVYRQHGWGYIESFILRDNLSRFTEPVWGPRRGVFFYAPVIVGDLFPWSLFLIAAAWLAIKNLAQRIGRKQPAEKSEVGPSALPAIWALVIIVFFSISRNKEDLYILPAYAAAAAIIGILLARIDLQTPLIKVFTVALGAILALAGATILYALASPRMPYRLAGATAAGAILSAVGLIMIALAGLKKHFAAIALSALGMIAVNYVFVLRILPDFERYKPVLPSCEVIRTAASEDAMIGYYRIGSPSMAFYLRRPVFEYYREEEIVSAFSSGREVYCLMTESDYERVKELFPTETYVLATRPLFQVKLRGIFERKDVPQTVLISNRSQASDLK